MRRIHRFFGIFITLSLFFSGTNGIVFGKTTQYAFTLPARDIDAAKDICDNSPLKPIDGIWEYPAEDIVLIITPDKSEKGLHNALVVTSSDMRLKPGMCVARIYESIDPGIFRMEISSKLKKGYPSSFVKCSAKLDQSKSALFINAPRLKLQFYPSLILSSLWKYVRLPIRLKYEDPESELPYGWRKIYPDGQKETIVRSYL